MNGTRAAILAGLIICATLTGWLLQNQDAYTTTTTSSEHGHDMFARGMDLDVMDAVGALHYRIKADSMYHYPGDDHVQLTRPVMDIFRQAQPQWHIESDSSRLADSGATIKLLGEVHIKRMKTEEDQELVIHTRDLIVKPEKQLAETEHRAVIESGRYMIEGVGMHADFTTNRLELHSRVRGRFDVSG